MDIKGYDRAEMLARQAMPTWRHSQAHDPNLFKQAAFPVRVESTADLIAISSTMQESRATGYQTELGGLNDIEFSLIVSVLQDFCLFFRDTFHTNKIPLPLSTVLSQYSAFKKIMGWSDSVNSVLEIGPGCGYMSFFMLRSAVKNYTQIEATQSFYMLQHLVNNHCYGQDQKEHAAYDITAASDLFYHSSSVDHGGEDGKHTVMMGDQKPAVDHYPWWRIGELAASGRKFDVVTANAVISELSQQAFVEYLDLIDKVLAPEGALVIECFGGGPLKPNLIIEGFDKIKLAPLVVVGNGYQQDNRYFVTPNSVLVRDTHPLYPTLLNNKGAFPLYTDHPIVHRMYDVDKSAPRRMYSPQEFVDAVTKLVG